MQMEKYPKGKWPPNDKWQMMQKLPWCWGLSFGTDNVSDTRKGSTRNVASEMMRGKTDFRVQLPVKLDWQWIPELCKAMLLNMWYYWYFSEDTFVNGWLFWYYLNFSVWLWCFFWKHSVQIFQIFATKIFQNLSFINVVIWCHY